MNKTLTYIDLFAGAGGLSEGFIREGYEPIAHVEMDEAACYSLRTRAAYHYLKGTSEGKKYDEYLRNEISRNALYSIVPQDILDSVINLPIGEDTNAEVHNNINRHLGQKDVDLIIGGPPCQAYSLVGRARSKNGMSGDPRNYLYVHYANYLEKYTPKMFVFENVIGLKSAGGGLHLKNMEKLFEKKGYGMHLFVVETNNFGVLQKRRRVIIIGWRKDFVPNIPNLESIREEPSCNVEVLLKDLPAISAGEGIDRYCGYAKKPSDYLREKQIRIKDNILTQHIARPHTEQDKHIYRIAVEKWNNERQRLNYNSLPDELKTHQNRKSFFDRFKVVAEDLPYSQTVVAHIAKDGHYYIHPDLNQNRSLTVREAARLQSFPDDFYFEGVKEGKNRTAAFKQIGNAVPPLMAEAIAKNIMKLF